MKARKVQPAALTEVCSSESYMKASGNVDQSISTAPLSECILGLSVCVREIDMKNWLAQGTECRHLRRQRLSLHKSGSSYIKLQCL